MYTPQQIVEIAYETSPVVMMNETHDGYSRCIRTREVGLSILSIAHGLGVRHLAMEALPRQFALDANRKRVVPDYPHGYLSQPEMRAFMQEALHLGWTLVAYEYEPPRTELVTATNDTKAKLKRSRTRKNSSIALDLDKINEREEGQAENLSGALNSLPSAARLLIWCGNGHLTKIALDGLDPMGHRFWTKTGIEPFVIDQTGTVLWPHSGRLDRRYRKRLVREYRNQLKEMGGTGGFLHNEAPELLTRFRGSDAYLLSIYNTLE